MTKKSTSKKSSVKKATSPCQIFYERLDGEPAYKLPKGQRFFSPERERPVLKLVYQAAKDLGHNFPSLSFVKRAELFYHDDALVEMRVSGQCAVGTNHKDELLLEEWFTPAGPKFSLGQKLKLKMARADAGRSYIIVVRADSGTMVWWDLSTQYRYEELSEAEEAQPRPKILLQPEEPPSEAKRLLSTGEMPTSEIRERVSKLEAETLTQVLIPEPPIGTKEIFWIKLGEPHRLLVHIVDKAWVEYKLAIRYAQSRRCDQRLLEELATNRGLSLDQAKIALVRNMLSEQIVFVQESIENIQEQNWEVLKDIFDLSLNDSVYEMALADWVPLGSVWFPLGSIKEKDSDELKKPILKMEIEQAKARLGMRGKGRIKMTFDERGQVGNERTAMIKKAVKDACLAAKDSGKNEFAAEDYVTPAEVAKKIQKSVSTLYRWLESCNLIFEDLRSEALQKVFRK
jgi:hypothetical protein